MQIDNTFNKGLNLDLNPISVPNDTLVNCLNGTLITGNGNESMLQPDMGNVQIQDAYLPAGYVPVGMKEYGGIVYVASKNPITGDCLIGSFPSPELNIDMEDTNSTEEEITLDDFLETSNLNIKTLKFTDISYKLSDELLRPGDMFKITNLNYEDGKMTTGDIAFSLVVKTSDNSMTTINKVNEGFNYFLESSPGLLYLKASVPIPEDFYVSLVSITGDKSSGYTVKFSSNYEVYIDDETLVIETPTESGEVMFTITTDDPQYLYSAIPIKKYGETEVKIPQLTLNGTVDCVAAQSGNATLDTWRYIYNNNNLKLFYGLSNAFDVKGVKFIFYLFTQDSQGNYIFDMDSGVDISALSRRNYTGQFSQNIAELMPNSLYLTKIIVTKNDNTQQEFYKWTWTNGLLNDYQNNFVGAKIPLNVVNYISTKYSEKETSDYTDLLNNITTVSSNNEVIRTTITYAKEVEFSSESNIKLVEKELLPFDAGYFNATNTIKYEKQSIKLLFDYNGNYKLSDESTYTDSIEANTLKLTAKYDFVANPILQSIKLSNYIILQYLTEDSKKYIFGETINNIPKYVLGMGMGKKDNKVHTFYNLSEGSKESEEEYSYDSLINNGPDSSSHRLWSFINENLKNWLFKKLGYLPIIVLLDSNAYSPKIAEGGEEGGGRANYLFTLDKITTDDTYGVTGVYHYDEYSIILWYDGYSYNIVNSFGVNSENSINMVKNAIGNLYITSTEIHNETVDTNKYVADKDSYGYTTENKITYHVKVNIHASELLEKEEKQNDLYTTITEAIPNYITDAALHNSNNIQFDITYKYYPIDESISVVLENKDIYPIVNAHINPNYINKVCYIDDSNNVYYKDGKGLDFNNKTIYYKNTSDNMLYPITSAVDGNSAKPLIDKVKIMLYNGINHIVIDNSKNDVDLLNVGINNKKSIHGEEFLISNSKVPCIGDGVNYYYNADNHHGSYPFSFVQGYDRDKSGFYSNQKYLSDIKFLDASYYLWQLST